MSKKQAVKDFATDIKARCYIISGLMSKMNESQMKLSKKLDRAQPTISLILNYKKIDAESERIFDYLEKEYVKNHGREAFEKMLKHLKKEFDLVEGASQ